MSQRFARLRDLLPQPEPSAIPTVAAAIAPGIGCMNAEPAIAPASARVVHKHSNQHLPRGEEEEEDDEEVELEDEEEEEE